MKVLVTSKSFGKLSKEPVRRLEEAGFTVILNDTGKTAYGRRNGRSHSGDRCCYSWDRGFNRNVIDHADRLKIVSRYGVGLDKIDVEYLEEKGNSAADCQIC